MGELADFQRFGNNDNIMKLIKPRFLNLNVLCDFIISYVFLTWKIIPQGMNSLLGKRMFVAKCIICYGVPLGFYLGTGFKAMNGAGIIFNSALR